MNNMDIGRKRILIWQFTSFMKKKIITNINRKNPVAALFMNMSKAFDFVDCIILLNKLERYGVRGNALNLLKSYLADRKQVTQIDKICIKSKTERTYVSSQRPTNYGVPQASILGPLLFLIYINDMPRETHHPMVLFADDSTVVFSANNNTNMTFEREINDCLQVLIKWMNANNLKINFDKTKMMTFEQRTNYKKKKKT